MRSTAGRTAIGVAAVVAAGCSRAPVASQVERGVTRDLGAKGLPVTAVRCPAGMRAGAGSTATCAGRLDGQDLALTVTFSSRSTYGVAPVRPVVDLRDVEARIATDIATRIHAARTVDCGRPRSFLVADVGATFACTGAAADGSSVAITATVAGTDGRVTYEVA